jgi:mannose-1-phosphate guanylyltransferase/phosphomannomutase
MILWTLDLLNNLGVEEVILGVNYLAEDLQANLGSTYKALKIKYSLESQQLGTAGPLKLASLNAEINETFIAMNGDVIAEINLQGMLKQHERTHALVTDALHEVKSTSRFGVVQIDGENKIQRFIEKPKPGAAPSHLVNAGIYIIKPEVLQLIPRNRKVSLEREIFPTIANQGRLYGFPFSGNWFDIGNLSDYRRANFTLLRSSTPSSTEQGRNTEVAVDALIQKPVSLGDDSRVESKAVVGPNVVLGKNGFVARNAKVANSILFDGVRVGEGSDVYGAILASGVTVGKRAKIGRGSIISPKVTIADRVKIAPGAIIHPYKEIDRSVRAAAHVM